MDLTTFNSVESLPEGFWRWGPFITPQEVACNGTGKIGVHEGMLDALLKARKEYGKPFHYTNIFRSKEHNDAIGGAEKSYHVRGMAADIAVIPGGRDPQRLEAILRKHGFNGFGFYPDRKFLHADFRNKPAEWGQRWPEGFNKET